MSLQLFGRFFVPVRIDILDLYVPSEEEKADATLYQNYLFGYQSLEKET